MSVIFECAKESTRSFGRASLAEGSAFAEKLAAAVAVVDEVGAPRVVDIELVEAETHEKHVEVNIDGI